MKLDWKKLIIAIAIPLAVGGVSAFLTQNSMMTFASVQKPPLSPPGWLFPVVWTLLYTLMGIASYLIITSGTTSNSDIFHAMIIYGLQLFFDFFWSIIFFNLENYLFAFIWLCALLFLILLNALLFYRISKLAGLLLIPYILWVTFAGYLNYGIYLLS